MSWSPNTASICHSTGKSETFVAVDRSTLRLPVAATAISQAAVHMFTSKILLAGDKPISTL